MRGQPDGRDRGPRCDVPRRRRRRRYLSSANGSSSISKRAAGAAFSVTTTMEVRCSKIRRRSRKVASSNAYDRRPSSGWSCVGVEDGACGGEHGDERGPSHHGERVSSAVHRGHSRCMSRKSAKETTCLVTSPFPQSSESRRDIAVNPCNGSTRGHFQSAQMPCLSTLFLRPREDSNLRHSI